MSDNGENGSSDQNNWLRKGWIWALKGWTKFLILALIILFVVLLYQSWSFVNKTTHQLTISPLLKNCNTPQDYLFTIAYPEKILIAEENAPARFIMVSVTQPRPFTTSITVTVQLHPQKEGVIFSDAKGNLLPAKLSLAPEQPGKLYISRQPLAAPAAIVPISVTCASILTPTKDIPLTAFDLNIESASGAFWRRFRELLLGPTTTLLAVVGSLIAVGFKLWEGEEEERKRKAEEDERKRKAQEDERKRKAQEDEKQKYAEWQRAAQGKIGFQQWGTLLSILPDLRMVIKEPHYTSDVKNWMGIVGLQFNPFSPERADFDRRLFEYKFIPPNLHPDALRTLSDRAPSLLFGATGSGKTATARWLIDYCSALPANPKIPATLPVYCPLSLGLQNSKNADYLSLLSQSISRALVVFFVIHAYTFVLLPQRKKSAKYLSKSFVAFESRVK